ncbi:MAG: hypothetical protein NZM18_13305 [Thermoflexales bacterium]|nr:hypothetical protein [Thermoflexales bacterium]MDW8351660.1 hypothetical protein [Anaerolineae bacterium]
MADIVINGYAIDDKLLQRKPIRRCQIARCRAACCADGVWVDYAHAQRILAQAELIRPFMPEERRDPATWFAELHDDDPAFPSGRYTGTTTVEERSYPGGTTCVFLRPDDHACAIQAASIAHGLPPWELKPYYCCLFPLVDEHVDADGRPLPVKRLTLDDENDLFNRGGGCYEACARDPEYVFQVYAEEVALALGLEGYRALCAIVGVAPRL